MGVLDDLKKRANSGEGTATAAPEMVKPERRKPGRPRKTDSPPRPPPQPPDPLTQAITATVQRIQKAGAEAAGRPPRDAAGKFLGGNPNGARPKSLVQMIDACTTGGLELVMFHSAVFHGEIKVTETRYTKDGDAYEVETGPTIKERQASAGWLADRKWGKAPDVVKLESTHKSEVNVNVSLMSPEKVRTMLALVREQQEIAEGEIVSDEQPDLPGTDQRPALPFEVTVSTKDTHQD